MLPAELPPESRPASPSHAVRQFARLALPYWKSERRWRIGGMTLLFLLLTIGQVVLVMWTSYWNRAFFDALEARSLDALLQQILTFTLILALTMAVTAWHMHVKRWLQLDWRRWLTANLVDQWMTRSHHYRLQFIKGEHDNPDQRIAEDIRIATEAAVSLAHSLTYSLLVGWGFIAILAEVSGSAPIPGSELEVPGYMVLLAFAYAGGGATIGYLLGRPLVRATNRLQSLEANLRFSLARARENAEAIALTHGERMERRGAVQRFGDVARGWNRQTLAYLGIVSFSTAYGNLMPIFPILVAAPQFIAGALTLGGLMQSAQAFERLASALSWPIDKLGEIAMWRTSAGRVVNLHEDMLRLDVIDGASETAQVRIGYTTRPELHLQGLTLVTPGGEPLIRNLDLRVRRGERILIVGDAHVTLALFKAVAGLWPWGSGKINLPEGQEVAFLPQRPFLPASTLRTVLCYPHPPERYATPDLYRALECAGIDWLAPRLDEADDWNHVLPLRAQQRLSTARLFLQRPAWVFLEDTTDAFDPKGEARIMEMLHHEMPDMSLLSVMRHSGLAHFFHRRIELHRGSTDGAAEASPVLAPAAPSAELGR
ncbi:ABC transporter ATP-binding protein/permease [Aromatoleum toluvorans]|uniref:ABC transporter ATP-binding protein/permease n=1 Tax=Aromatoleum toluvorans TaxID=92002 RepID=A0ABX1PUP5_9RHOO|nr:ABC transporter ATP-binding protein/permease [Aromatoleum toluvorans]NMG43174.1 ABC transporter ATP-binding protein/permease [Aromatoleum toluvorans]